MKTGCVYLIRNLINGKGYVGRTIVAPEVRWQSHISSAQKGVDTPLYRAIRKYGVSRFSAEVVWRGRAADVNSKERELIKTLSTHVSASGYNVTWGGDGVVGLRQSEISRAATSAGLRIYFQNPVNRKKLSVMQKAVWKRPGYRERVVGAITRGLRASEKLTYTAERKAASSVAAKLRWQNPKYRANQARACKAAWSGSKGRVLREKHSRAATLRYKDPAQRCKTAESTKRVWALRKQEVA